MESKAQCDLDFWKNSDYLCISDQVECYIYQRNNMGFEKKRNYYNFCDWNAKSAYNPNNYLYYSLPLYDFILTFTPLDPDFTVFECDEPFFSLLL